MNATTQKATDLLKRLISFRSISSAGNRAISDHLSELLHNDGFVVEQTTYVDEKGIEKVNVVACRDPHAGGTTDDTVQSGGLAYFAHTDVVPVPTWTGPGEDASAFDAVLIDDRVYGRGACDMKGSISAMLTAATTISVNEQKRPLWIVCTADEEVGFEGARHVVKNATAYRDIVAAQPVSIIGEPTELGVVHAHKGITGFEVTSHGRSAHSSTDEGVNANEALMPVLQLVDQINQITRRDPAYQDSRFNPPHLSWNYGIRNAESAINITTQQASVWVSFRTMPGIDGEDLIARVEAKSQELKLEFKRYDGGAPVWVDADEPFIADLCRMTGGPPAVACYGTDGGEFAELKHRAVLGPGGIGQAHTSDEWISLDQLGRGAQLYADLIRRYCC
jgi:acetylornithine deacetylase